MGVYLQKRIDWIDSLKIFGILAVILGHLNSPFGGFIFSWHMPLFFLISGFFIKHEESFIEYSKKESLRLMLPYFIFALLGLFVEALKRYALQRDGLDFVNEFQGIFIWMDMSSLINTYAFVLWFLPALFFSKIILFLVIKHIKNIQYQIALVLLLFGSSFTMNLPFGMDNALNALIFIFIGNKFYCYFEDSQYIYLSPFILFGILIIYGVPSLDMATKSYENTFMVVIYSVFFIVSLIAIFKNLNLNYKILDIWKKNIMLIFVFHVYTNNIAYIVSNKLIESEYSWVLAFLLSLIILHLSILTKDKWQKLA